MTTKTELLELYDTLVRGWTGDAGPDLSFQQAGSVVRMVGAESEAHSNGILRSQLSTHDADQVIVDQIAFFQSLGHSFEWKHFSHDEPSDLPERLKAAGLQAQDQETLVAIETSREQIAPLSVEGVRMDTLIDAALVQSTIRQVNEAVYGDAATAEWIAGAIAKEKQENPDSLSIHAAFAEDRPVSVAWTRHERGNPFGGLFGGSTLEEWRGRGIYSALVARRVAEARERGCRWLTVDCSPLSIPILEKRGFQRLSIITPFIWEYNPR